MSDYDQLAYNLRKPLSPYFPTYAAVLDLGRGSAFPTIGSDGGAVAVGSRFFRTDIGFLCYYDGTRWLSENDYPTNLSSWQSYGTTSPQQTNYVLPRGQYSPYFTRVLIHSQVSGTNNGTNFWTIDVQGVNFSASSSSSIHSITTAADSAGVVVRRDVGVTTAAPTHRDWMRVLLTKTLTPGAIEVAVTLSYKLVIT